MLFVELAVGCAVLALAYFLVGWAWILIAPNKDGRMAKAYRLRDAIRRNPFNFRSFMGMKK